MSPDVRRRSANTSWLGQYRLDRLLLKKAEQGVKIFIVVYKEVTQTMSSSRAGGRIATLRSCHSAQAMSSAHTKHHLEDCHENIAVMRYGNSIT